MAESRDALLMDAIDYYQKKLETHRITGNVEELLHALKKISRFPIKSCDLMETDVALTVLKLREIEGPVGENAKSLFEKWLKMLQDSIRAAFEENIGEEIQDEEPGENELPREE